MKESFIQCPSCNNTIKVDTHEYDFESDKVVSASLDSISSVNFGFKFFELDGRASRREWWIKTLTYTGINFLLLFLVLLPLPYISVIPYVVFLLLSTFDLISTNIRRFHDINNNGFIVIPASFFYGLFWISNLFPCLLDVILGTEGNKDPTWFIFLNTFFVLNIIIFLIAGFLPGTKGLNKYGCEPRV